MGNNFNTVYCKEENFRIGKYFVDSVYFIRTVKFFSKILFVHKLNFFYQICMIFLADEENRCNLQDLLFIIKN